MNKYDFELDLKSENPTSIIISMISKMSRILEFGSSFGRLTKYLKEEMECKVDIVEIDEVAGAEASKYAEKYCIGVDEGNIENYKWTKVFQGEKYDYIIFQDVLEHLYNQEILFSKCKEFLKDEGAILISIPNIAHNSIILNLINDEFQYNKIGLLDDTHIRFFTYKSLQRLIGMTGYVTTIEKAVYHTVEETEFNIGYDTVDRCIEKGLRGRKTGNIYQYILKIQKNKNYFEEGINKTIRLEESLNYNTVFYIKEETDQTFCENKTVRTLINPSQNVFNINLKDFNKIKEIRIDPINVNCIIKIIEIYIITNNGKQKVEIDFSNGLELVDNIYLFTTEDPQIFISEIGEDIENIYFECLFLDYNSDFVTIYEEIIIKYTELLNKNKMHMNVEKTRLNELINEKEDFSAQLERELLTCTNELNLTKKELELSVSNVETKKNDLEMKCAEVEQLRKELKNILNSKCWRFTKIFRRNN